MLKYLVAFSSILISSACQTTADPESYMAFDCQQLRALSQSEGPPDPFVNNQVGPDPQAGLIGDRRGLETESAVASSERDDETRAIRAAYRAKNCR